MAQIPSTFDYLRYTDFSERTVQLLAVPIVVAEPDPRRIAIRFQLANFSNLDPIIGTHGRVSTDQNVTAITGFPVALALYQEFQFGLWGPVVTARWYGVLGGGLPQLTILEQFWKPY